MDGQPQQTQPQPTEAPAEALSNILQAPSSEDSNKATSSTDVDSLLGGLLDSDAPPDVGVEPDYNYDYNDIQLDNQLIGSDADKSLANSIAKELGLSRDQARKLYQIGGNLLRKQYGDNQSKVISQWNQEINSDPEIGGSNLNTSMGDFRKALDAFGSPELRQLLTQHPIHHNPVVFKFIVKAGRAISNDNNFIQGEGSSPPKLTNEQRFLRQFPNSGYLLDDTFNN